MNKNFCTNKTFCSGGAKNIRCKPIYLQSYIISYQEWNFTFLKNYPISALSFNYLQGLKFTIGGSFFSRMASSDSSNEFDPAEKADPQLLKKARETPKGKLVALQ